MALPNRVVLFGDQTVDPCPIIKHLCRQSTDSSTLQAFFQKSSDAVRQEVSFAESSDRAKFPAFDSILHLSEIYAKRESTNEAVSSVLLCVAQLGLLLRCVVQCMTKAQR